MQFHLQILAMLNGIGPGFGALLASSHTPTHQNQKRHLMFNGLAGTPTILSDLFPATADYVSPESPGPNRTLPHTSLTRPLFVILVA